ncbi:MAG TPA: S1/P1 nuclease [Pyrinomonadaceae bacterium]
MNKRQHRSLFKSALSIFIIGLILSPATFGWGAGGHMMTANIAFRRLNPKAKAKVAELLAVKINPAAVTVKSKDFVNAAHWADDLRPFTEFDSFKPLHFIDKPFSTDGTTLPVIEADNIVKALEDNVNILKTSNDKKAQAQALRFIIHFVGDIHQPLHCTARVSHALPGGDHGGNLFKIMLMGADGKFKESNLHSYWDGGIRNFPPTGPNFAPPSLKSVALAANRISAANPDTDPDLKLDDPFNFNAWADESFQIGQTDVYKGVLSGRRPRASYNTRALRLAQKRVAWGGYRLAALLNSIWPE